MTTTTVEAIVPARNLVPKQVICPLPECGLEVTGYGRRTYCTDRHRWLAATRRRRARSQQFRQLTHEPRNPDGI